MVHASRWLLTNRMSELLTSGSVGGAAGNRCLYPAADPRLRRSVVSWGLWKVRFGWLRFLGSPGAGG